MQARISERVQFDPFNRQVGEYLDFELVREIPILPGVVQFCRSVYMHYRLEIEWELKRA